MLSISVVKTNAIRKIFLSIFFLVVQVLKINRSF